MFWNMNEVQTLKVPLVEMVSLIGTNMIVIAAHFEKHTSAMC